VKPEAKKDIKPKRELSPSFFGRGLGLGGPSFAPQYLGEMIYPEDEYFEEPCFDFPEEFDEGDPAWW
jgi:hypothetical protein